VEDFWGYAPTVQGEASKTIYGAIEKAQPFRTSLRQRRKAGEPLTDI
jgi:hypothetical protein